MAAKKESGHKKTGIGNHRRNVDPEEKRRKVKPVEGAQTGSQGLGYLKDADKIAGKKGKPERRVR